MKKMKMPKNMGKIIAHVVAIVGVIAVIHAACSPHHVPSRVMKLGSPKTGQCSGIQVHTPAGQDLILSAAHCAGIADAHGSILITTEDGRQLKRKIIAEDSNSDLLLIEGIPGMRGIPVGKMLARGEKVHTDTHGAGHPTYHTEGVIVGDMQVSVVVAEITSPEALMACQEHAKNAVVTDGISLLCLMSVQETITTAFMTPGSSGGAITNTRGELVGICSAGDGKFSFIVRLVDIQKFLSNY